MSYYGFPQADEVRTPDGRLVGISQLSGYNANERAALSLVSLDEAHAEIGTELVLTWGEINRGVAQAARRTARAKASPRDSLSDALLEIGQGIDAFGSLTLAWLDDPGHDWRGVRTSV